MVLWVTTALAGVGLTSATAYFWRPLSIWWRLELPKYFRRRQRIERTARRWSVESPVDAELRRMPRPKVAIARPVDVRSEQRLNYLRTELDRVARKVLKDLIVIDTNIWANKRYNDYFLILETILISHRKRMSMDLSQLSEIVRKRRESQRSGEDSGLWTRAMARIEAMQQRGVLELPIGAEEVPRNRAMFDKALLTIVKNACWERKSMYVGTDDTHLRIQLRATTGEGHEATGIVIEEGIELCNESVLRDLAMAIRNDQLPDVAPKHPLFTP